MDCKVCSKEIVEGLEKTEEYYRIVAHKVDLMGTVFQIAEVELCKDCYDKIELLKEDK